MKRGPRLLSLQARLLALLLGLVTAVWVGAALITLVDARHEVDELLDGHLAQSAAMLAAQQNAKDNDDDDEVVDAPSLHKYAPRVAFQVFHEGQLIMRSPNVGLSPMSRLERGFETTQAPDGTQWRVFATRGVERDVQVYVGEQLSARNLIHSTIARSLFLPLGIALLLLAGAGWWAVRQGLAPLRHLGHTLSHRQPQALEPIDLTVLPPEMRPMVQALNDLFKRIETMVEVERRFTADAAHELRTPIAAIRMQAQVALGAVRDSTQRNHALQLTLAGCDRATRLVEQLLTLARLEATFDAKNMDMTALVDLGAVAQRVIADLGLKAIGRRQVLELDASQAIRTPGDEVLMGVLVRNLVDNAMRYSPEEARIQVDVCQQDDHAVLRVQDSGPGMSDAEIERLGERFFRVTGQAQPGSGLGWSIVRRVAAVHGAQLRVSRSAQWGGLQVEVVFQPRGLHAP